jgi:RNA polymerase sigma-70 factor (ECF subfamily)
MPDAARDNESWVRDLASDGGAGDEARRDLRALFVQSLRRVLARRGISDDLCEDFAQEALVRVRERLASFRGESRFTTWALSICTRVAFDDLRHKHWKDASFEALVEESQGAVVFEEPPEALPDRRLLRERVLGTLAEVIDKQLTDKQRAVLNAELQGMPHAEIAAHLGMNRNALYKLSHDARKRVKAHLQAAGLSEADVLWVFE